MDLGCLAPKKKKCSSKERRSEFRNNDRNLIFFRQFCFKGSMECASMAAVNQIKHTLVLVSPLKVPNFLVFVCESLFTVYPCTIEKPFQAIPERFLRIFKIAELICISSKLKIRNGNYS